MVKSRAFAIELAAQVILALAIGSLVSIVLAGAALLLANDSGADRAAPAASASRQAAR